MLLSISGLVHFPNADGLPFAGPRPEPACCVIPDIFDIFEVIAPAASDPDRWAASRRAEHNRPVAARGRVYELGHALRCPVMAAEVAALPEGAAIVGRLADCTVLRGQVRGCGAFRA